MGGFVLDHGALLWKLLVGGGALVSASVISGTVTSKSASRLVIWGASAAAVALSLMAALFLAGLWAYREVAAGDSTSALPLYIGAATPYFRHKVLYAAMLANGKYPRDVRLAVEAGLGDSCLSAVLDSDPRDLDRAFDASRGCANPTVRASVALQSGHDEVEEPGAEAEVALLLDAEAGRWRSALDDLHRVNVAAPCSEATQAAPDPCVDDVYGALAAGTACQPGCRAACRIAVEAEHGDLPADALDDARRRQPPDAHAERPVTGPDWLVLVSPRASLQPHDRLTRAYLEAEIGEIETARATLATLPALEPGSRQLAVLLDVREGIVRDGETAADLAALDDATQALDRRPPHELVDAACADRRPIREAFHGQGRLLARAIRACGVQTIGLWSVLAALPRTRDGLDVVRTAIDDDQTGAHSLPREPYDMFETASLYRDVYRVAGNAADAKRVDLILARRRRPLLAPATAFVLSLTSPWPARPRPLGCGRQSR